MTLFPSQSWPLTSGTTNGTSSSYLKADELSTTTPFSENPAPISLGTIRVGDDLI